jgi:ferredoxin-type protein NapH
MQWMCSPVFHCYSCPWATFACPIGVIANFSALHLIPFLAIGTLLAVGVLFGTLVCGWACPFGFLQDLAAKVPTPKLRLPSWMGYCRYVVLVGLVLAVPYFLGEKHPLFFCSVCPAGALEGAVPRLMWPGLVKTAILALFVVAVFFAWRPWCTLFCPLGAIFSLCNRVSFLFVRFRPDRCNDCDLCRDLCKYRGPSERRSGDLRCIRCLDCVRCRAISVGTVFGRRDKPELVQTDPPAP